MSGGDLQLITLTDGGQTAESVGDRLFEFLAGARQSLEIAIYDLALPAPLHDRLALTLRDRIAGGVRARMVYNVDHPRAQPYPPPPRTNPEAVIHLGVEARAVPGVPDLMHHKYVVRDAGTPEAAVWTGSTNWTGDSWTREENLILSLTSPALAAAYLRDFEELWEKGDVQASGHFDAPWADAADGTAAITCRPVFSPGRGRRMSHLVASRMGMARHRLRVCSPVITSAPVLGSLSEVPDTLDCRVVYDRTQMAEVLRQWAGNPNARWKGPVFEAAVRRLRSASKVTTPYHPGSVHDYMHAKLVVADDTVLLGSYNLSHSGESNAENVVELRDAALADRLAAFVDAVFDRYA